MGLLRRSGLSQLHRLCSFSQKINKIVKTTPVWFCYGSQAKSILQSVQVAPLNYVLARWPVSGSGTVFHCCRSAQTVPAFEAIVKVTNNYVCTFGLIMEFETALLLARTQILQNDHIYILYNSVCWIHFRPLKIQLNYWNCLSLNFSMHLPPSAPTPHENFFSVNQSEE